MFEFYYTKYSVSSLAFALMAGVVFIYNIRNWQEKSARFLGGLFLGLFFLFTGNFLIASVVSQNSAVFFHISYLVFLGVACLPQFAYFLGGNADQKEARVILAVSLVAGTLVYIQAAHSVSAGHATYYSFVIHNFTVKIPPASGLYILVTVAWTISILIRKYLRPAAAQRLIRNYIVFLTVSLAIALTINAYSFEWISFTFFRPLLDILYATMFATYFAFYVGKVIHDSQFWVKLAWISLLSTCIVTIILSNLIYQSKEKSYVAVKKAEISFLEKMTAFEALPQNIAYITRLSDKPEESRPVYLSEPLRKSGGAVLSRSRLDSKTSEISYRFDGTGIYVAFFFQKGGQDFEVGFPYWEYRQMSHSNTGIILVVILGIGLLILIVFPKIFQNSGAAKKVQKKRTFLENKNIPEIVAELSRLMLIEKLYQDENLSLPSLASELKLSSHQLSELLNDHIRKNFNTFVNEYRVEEAKRLLVLDEELDILSVAFSSGFKSKSPFNTTFKRFTGMNPNQFRNRFRENTKK